MPGLFRSNAAQCLLLLAVVCLPAAAPASSQGTGSPYAAAQGDSSPYDPGHDAAPPTPAEFPATIRPSPYQPVANGSSPHNVYGPGGRCPAEPDELLEALLRGSARGPGHPQTASRQAGVVYLDDALLYCYITLHDLLRDLAGRESLTVTRIDSGFVFNTVRQGAERLRGAAQRPMRPTGITQTPGRVGSNCEDVFRDEMAKNSAPVARSSELVRIANEKMANVKRAACYAEYGPFSPYGTDMWSLVMNGRLGCDDALAYDRAAISRTRRAPIPAEYRDAQINTIEINSTLVRQFCDR